MEFLAAFESVTARVAAACARAGRDSSEVTVVGASKGVDAHRLADCCTGGLRHLGENYLQEAQEKLGPVSAACPGVTWHFIGALQSNKAASVVSRFALVHSVDRAALARALNVQAGRVGESLEILLQVNVGLEPGKAGVAPDSLAELYYLCRSLPHLRVKGLMSLPPVCPEPAATRAFHRQLRELRDNLEQNQSPGENPLPWLSMGMSSDFEVAIEEGATHVRIGSALFGARG